MPEQNQSKINDLFTKQHASNERLDYFMCSVAGGLFAYIGQTFAPEKVSVKCSASTFAALILLTGSFYCGFKRIQAQNAITLTNKKLFESEDQLAKRIEALNKFQEDEQRGIKDSFFQDDLGRKFNKEQVKQEKIQFETEYEQQELNMDANMNLYAQYGAYRDRLLLIGFISIIVAKVFQWFPI